MRKHGGTPSWRDKHVTLAAISPPGVARGRFVGGHLSGLAGYKSPALFKRGASSCSSQRQRHREPRGASPRPSAPTYLPTWQKWLHHTLCSRGSPLAENVPGGGGEKAQVEVKAGCGPSIKMVGYLVAEKAGMAFNPFCPQAQRVAVHKVVDRGGPSANGVEGILTTGRGLDGLVRHNDLFLVHEKYYIAIREPPVQPAVSSGRTPVLCPQGRWVGRGQAQDFGPAIWME